MKDLLQEKIDSLAQAKEYECWYLVKQTVDFTSLCYKVKALEDYKLKGRGTNLENYIKNYISSVKQSKPDLNIEENYRQLRIAAYFGLIRMSNSKYEDATITQVFHEIENLCGGEFEKTTLYQEVIDRQIEKLYVSSNIDEGKNSTRQEFTIFPTIFLYKLLLEIGNSTGNYTITLNEYRYLVTTTKKYEDFIDTLILIKLLRGNPSANDQLSIFRTKFDNRINQALGLLSTLIFDKDSISLNIEKLDEVKSKVFNYECHKQEIENSNYIDFLCSSNGFLVFTTTPNLAYLSPEWLKSKEHKYVSFDKDADVFVTLFNQKYGIEALKRVNKNELAEYLFLGIRDDNLCHELEYNETSKRLFASIGGGSAYSYPCFYKQDIQSWVTGSSRKNHTISVEEANRIAEETLAKLIDGYDIILSFKDKLLEKENYLELYVALVEKIGSLADKQWVIKYYTILFSKLFSPYYSDEWQKKALKALNCESDDNNYVQNGTITLVAKEADISTIVLSRIIYDIIDGKYDDDKPNDNLGLDLTSQQENDRVKNGENVIIYGVPGAGKSHLVQEDYLKGAKEDETYERLVFHPDYTYSDFVGQIMPIINPDKSVTYEFTAGPFSRILKKAYWNPNTMYFLVIEEVNRGNAAAIFGDIFQLLDRDIDGNSRYKITNKDIAKIVYGEEYGDKKVYIPSNLTILCTMNTSDQNVFTLDTAFQRRWKMRLVPNTFENDTSGIGNCKILDTGLTWEEFCTQINNIILEKSETLSSSEDKRLGTHFVEENDLIYSSASENRLFAEKVIKYLWDDVFKYDRGSLFDTQYKSLENVINDFINNQRLERFKIFKDDIQKDLEKIIHERKKSTKPDDSSSNQEEIND